MIYSIDFVKGCNNCMGQKCPVNFNKHTVQLI
jgi:hypothetical protein